MHATLKPDKIDRAFDTLTNIFKFAFLTLTLLSFNNLFAGNFALKLFSLAIAVLGGAIVLFRLFKAKHYIRFYGFPMLILFLISYFVSSLVNYQYGILENVQALIWMCFHFAICYASNTNELQETGKKSYTWLLLYFLFYVMLANIVSIAMLLVGYGRTAATSFNGNFSGYLWGRLWGVYTDPNIGAVFCVAAIVISLYFLACSKRTWAKILLSLNIFLSLCYISFSDSRTGLVSLAVTMFFYFFIALKASGKIKIYNVLKQVVCIVAAIILAGISVVSVTVIRKTYNTAAILVHEMNFFAQNTDPDDSETPSVPDPDDSETPSVPDPNDSETPPSANTIDRLGDELDEDISNRRFDLWKSGIEVWMHSPIFGTSHRNIVDFALDKTPDTYFVNNDRVGYFNSTHNAYLDVLLSQGIVGAIVFLVFFGMIVVLLFKTMIFSKDNHKCTPENILSTGLVITFAVSACFILEIVYINTAGAILFWSALGRLAKNLRE